jgi:rhodanese-related sulfurtransferase
MEIKPVVIGGVAGEATATARARRPTPTSFYIPLPLPRERLKELDKDKSYIPFCTAGLRSYIAHRILVQHGFRSRSLAGGFGT